MENGEKARGNKREKKGIGKNINTIRQCKSTTPRGKAIQMDAKVMKRVYGKKLFVANNGIRLGCRIGGNNIIGEWCLYLRGHRA